VGRAAEGRDWGSVGCAHGRAEATAGDMTGIEVVELAMAGDAFPVAPRGGSFSCKFRTRTEGQCPARVHIGYDLTSSRTASPSSVVMENAVGMALVPSCRVI
jgi:hypothetical protein